LEERENAILVRLSPLTQNVREGFQQQGQSRRQIAYGGERRCNSLLEGICSKEEGEGSPHMGEEEEEAVRMGEGGGGGGTRGRRRRKR
jgi:hypothetical protein